MQLNTSCRLLRHSTCLGFARREPFVRIPPQDCLTCLLLQNPTKKSAFQNITWFSEEKPGFQKAHGKYGFCTAFIGVLHVFFLRVSGSKTRFFNRKPDFRRVAGAKFGFCCPPHFVADGTSDNGRHAFHYYCVKNSAAAKHKTSTETTANKTPSCEMETPSPLDMLLVEAGYTSIGDGTKL